MVSIVSFTTRVPSSLAIDLVQACFLVFETLAISEGFQLCETENIEIVVIDADVDDHRANEIQHHQMTLRLSPETNAKELIAELWQMFPGRISEYSVEG